MPSRLRRSALAVPAALAGLALLCSACAGSGVTTLSSPPTTDTSPGSPGTTDTTPTTIAPPTVNVEIDTATMSLATYTLTDGTMWLLPTWQLSGPESGDTITGSSTYSNNVLAVDSQYVQLQDVPNGIG